jgi:hypothetical protein
MGASVCHGFALLCGGGLLYARSEDRKKCAALLAYSVLPILLVFVYSRLSTPVYLDRVFAGTGVLLPLMFCAPCAFQAGNRNGFINCWRSLS